MLGVTLLAGAGILVGLAGAPAAAEDGGVVVHSADMNDGSALNPMFSCTASGMTPTGGQVSPQLTADLSAISPAATTLAIIMHDEFGANQQWDSGDWAHWVSYNIAPAGDNAPDIPRDASQTDSLTGGVEAQNSWGEVGYRGPCPPPNGTHDYYFTVYALDTTLPAGLQNAQQLLAAMAGHVIDQGDLQVTFTTAEIGTTLGEVELVGDLGGTMEGDGPTGLGELLVNGVFAQPGTATLELNDSACVPDPGAVYGTDYTYSGGSSTITVPIPAGTYTGRDDTSIVIPGTLTIIDDTLVEVPECVTLELVGVTGGEIGDAGHSDFFDPGAATARIALTQSLLTIDDNDVAPPMPTIEFATATASADEATGGDLPMLLVYGTVTAPVTVTVTVTGGSAVSGADYATPVTVTVPAGTYDGTAATAIEILGFSITDDEAVEPDETIVFGLVSDDPELLVVGDADADGATTGALTFTIVDDDEVTPPTETPDPEEPPAETPGPSDPSDPPAETTAPSSGAGGSTGELAETGADADAMLMVGLGLLLVGGLAAVARSARRS